MLPPDLKFTPGQRVVINDSASEIVPDFVGLHGHVGIGGIGARHFFRGRYFVSLRLPTGANVIVQLPERCLDEAPTDYRL